MKFDQAFEPAALLGGKLAFFLADIAEEDDVVFGEFVQALGEFFDVILVAAADFAEAGLEQAGRRG